MNQTSAKDAWASSLFDISQPHMYAVVLPTLILFALGQRRVAVIYAIAGFGLLAFLSM